MFLKVFPILAFVSLTCVHAGTVLTYNLGWMGSDGYAMTGIFSFDSDSDADGLIDGTELLNFSISGFHNGNPAGIWRFTDPYTGLEPFNFNFDPTGLLFFTGGNSNSPTGQNWNDDGNAGNSCGTPGLGFNNGNFSQDLCVNGVKVSISDPSTPVATLAATSAAIPEPSTIAMFGIGLAGTAIAIYFRRRFRRV